MGQDQHWESSTEEAGVIIQAKRMATDPGQAGGVRGGEGQSERFGLGGEGQVV